MVADYNIKMVSRSLVRVPGSGQGQGAAAPAVSCDLGRVSSLASTITVNPYLPAIIAGGPKVAVPPSTGKMATNKLAAPEVLNSLTNTSDNMSRRRMLSPEPRDGADQVNKRSRLNVSSPSTNDRSSSISSRNNNNNRVIKVKVNTNQPQRVGASAASGVLLSTRRLATARRIQTERNTSLSIEDLYAEHIRLRQENQLLMQHLSYYMQLGHARRIQMCLPPGSGV